MSGRQTTAGSNGARPYQPDTIQHQREGAMLRRARTRCVETLLMGVFELAGMLAAEFGTARLRVRCIRHGHALMCVADGHLCTRCGLFWS